VNMLFLFAWSMIVFEGYDREDEFCGRESVWGKQNLRASLLNHLLGCFSSVILLFLI